MKKTIAISTLGFAVLFASAVVVTAPSAFAVEVQQTHHTTGVVKKVDLDKGRVMLAHDPVPSLDWPGMTMGFAVEDQAMLESLEPGQAVQFDFTEGKGGMFVVTDISPR